MRMSEEGYSFKFNKTVKQFICDQGYDPAFGARPIKRAIQKYVEDLIADAILTDQIEPREKPYAISKVKSEDKLTLKS
jgi:ATP-dependent Clp protease ATP-binding subunit ClpC